MRRILVALFALTVLAAIALSSDTGAQEKSRRQNNAVGGELFDGKPVYFATDEDHAFWFESVRLGTIGSKNYFVGVNTKFEGNFATGKSIWLHQDSVITIRPYNDMKELEYEFNEFRNRFKNRK